MRRWITALIVAGMRGTTRSGTGSRRWRRIIGAAAVFPLAVLGLTMASPGALADTGHCAVINSATNTTSKTLQAAVTAASPGATLWVRGTCTGTTTINTDLTITGQQPGGYPVPTLNGGGQGTVLTIDSGVTVTLNTLTITGGTGTSTGSEVVGGGIISFGTLTMNNSTVTGNTASFGGGGIFNTGPLTLNGNSSVSDNASLLGGGIFTGGRSSLTMNSNSSITGNVAGSPSNPGSGGGIFMSGGTVTMNGNSSISDNTATAGTGGGIVMPGARASVTMNDSSTITGNTASFGGGIDLNGSGSVTMNDSSTITGNTAGVDGGGITGNANQLHGCVAGVNVFGNHPDDIVP